MIRIFRCFQGGSRMMNNQKVKQNVDLLRPISSNKVQNRLLTALHVIMSQNTIYIYFYTQ